MTTTPTTDLDRIASDHLLHSTAADYDLNAEFAADMRAKRASAVADAIERDAAEQAAGNRKPWTPGQRQAMIDEGSAAEVAAQKMEQYAAFITESPKDWRDMRGDLDL